MRSKNVARAFFPAVFGGLLLTTALPAASHEVPPECIDPAIGQVRITSENFVLCSAFADDTPAVDAVPASLDPDPDPGLDPDPAPTAGPGNPGNDKSVGGATEGPGPHSPESFGPTGSVGKSG
jgi:hypothetical protein